MALATTLVRDSLSAAVAPAVFLIVMGRARRESSEEKPLEDGGGVDVGTAPPPF